MRNENDSTLKSTFIALTAIIAFIIGFITLAVKRGRLKELLISTSILIGTYFILYSIINSLQIYLDILGFLIIFGLPLGIYAIYWVYLFSCEKVTSLKVNSNWANRNWWWSLDGWEFEEEVARIFRLNGYKAKVTKKTGDGGIDIIMYKGKNKYLVQCKHYQNEVPVEPIRALNGVKEDFGADILILVASSGITKAGREFISNKPYFKVYTLEDIIAMGLRPSEDEDIVDAEVIEVKRLPKLN